MTISERCHVDRARRERISRFENVSLKNMFNVVVIETYRADPTANDQTIFEVKGTMNIGLPWPVKSVAASFAASNYTPKLEEKVERIRRAVSSPTSSSSNTTNDVADAKIDDDEPS